GRRRALLDDGRVPVVPPPVGVADGVRATLGDRGEEGLGGKRSLERRARVEAISRYTAHKSILGLETSLVGPLLASRYGLFTSEAWRSCGRYKGRGRTCREPFARGRFPRADPRAASGPRLGRGRRRVGRGTRERVPHHRGAPPVGRPA